MERPGRQRVQRHPALVAAWLSGLIAALLVGTLVVDPDLADRLSQEDGVVEWTQTALFVLTGALALRAAWVTWSGGASPVLELLVAAMLAGLVIGEVDLDRVLVGRKIIATRFLVDERVWLGWRALAAVVLVVPPAVLAIYALRRRAELLAAVARALGKPWGRTLLVGVVVFALTEVFERPLGRVPGIPRYMLEETLELIAGVWLTVALYAHARGLRVRRSPKLT